MNMKWHKKLDCDKGACKWKSNDNVVAKVI